MLWAGHDVGVLVGVLVVPRGGEAARDGLELDHEHGPRRTGCQDAVAEHQMDAWTRGQYREALQ